MPTATGGKTAVAYTVPAVAFVRIVQILRYANGKQPFTTDLD